MDVVGGGGITVCIGGGVNGAKVTDFMSLLSLVWFKANLGRAGCGGGVSGTGGGCGGGTGAAKGRAGPQGTSGGGPRGV